MSLTTVTTRLRLGRYPNGPVLLSRAGPRHAGDWNRCFLASGPADPTARRCRMCITLADTELGNRQPSLARPSSSTRLGTSIICRHYHQKDGVGGLPIRPCCHQFRQ